METGGPKASPLLVTAAIIEERGRFLVTQRPAHKQHANMWEFPGGKMEPGETPQQALKRELYEELEIDIRVDSIFDVIHYCYDWGPVLILAYRCCRIAGEIKHIEVSDHRWVTAEEFNLLKLLPADQPIVKHLQHCSPTAV